VNFFTHVDGGLGAGRNRKIHVQPAQANCYCGGIMAKPPPLKLSTVIARIARARKGDLLVIKSAQRQAKNPSNTLKSFVINGPRPPRKRKGP
jgi:hypothetical protein